MCSQPAASKVFEVKAHSEVKEQLSMYNEGLWCNGIKFPKIWLQ